MTRVIRLALMCAAAFVVFSTQVRAGETTNVVVASVPGIGRWGTIQFDHLGGALSIDALANSWTGGPTGFGIDDIYLTLLEDNGSPLTAFTGVHVTSNDDSGATFGDGSVSGLDSFIGLGALNAGPYLLTISHCCTDFNFSRDINSNSGIHQVGTSNTPDFQLTFSVDVEVNAINGVPAVPEPSSMALFGVGAIAVATGAACRRRRDC